MVMRVHLVIVTLYVLDAFFALGKLFLSRYARKNSLFKGSVQPNLRGRYLAITIESSL